MLLLINNLTENNFCWISKHCPKKFIWGHTILNSSITNRETVWYTCQGSRRSALRITRAIKLKNTEEKVLRAPFEFFARSLLSSMGNWATGRADMSSRHHARQGIRAIYCISDSSKYPFSFYPYFFTRYPTQRK